MKALVISATGDNIESDLIAAKATALYAEQTQLASARLYLTLRDVLETSRHQGLGLYKEFRDVAEKVGLSEDAESESVIMDNPVLDVESVSALRELCEGFRQGAFEIMPYDEVVETTVKMMRGQVPTHEVMPVLDQMTMTRLDGFYALNLQVFEHEPRGSLTKLDRISARPGWIINNCLAQMPFFPHKPWGDLLKMREEFKECRDALLLTISNIAQELDKVVEGGGTPAEVAKFAAYAWAKMESQRIQIGKEIGSLNQRWPTRLIGAGIPRPILAMGIAAFGIAAGVAAHHPAIAYTGLGAELAATLELSQDLVQLGSNQRKDRDKIKTSPYWFIHKTSHYFGQPNWKEGSY